MKVRIGVAVGAVPMDELGAVVDALDGLGFDSIWLPETFRRGTADPLVGLAFAAARVRRLKLGTHLVGPGRQPYVLAKALAQLDALSGGRLLVTMVPGLDDPAERLAQGWPTGNRTPWLDEQLPRLRRWWAGEEVDGLVLDARPRQDPLEVWLGGQAPAALTRAGRISDGWLAARMTIDEAIAARKVIDEAAAAAGREISREHFGTNLTVARDGSEPPIGDQVAAWVEAGFSKIVIRPAAPPDDWVAELGRMAAEVVHLQT